MLLISPGRSSGGVWTCSSKPHFNEARHQCIFQSPIPVVCIIDGSDLSQYDDGGQIHNGVNTTYIIIIAIFQHSFTCFFFQG